MAKAYTIKEASGELDAIRMEANNVPSLLGGGDKIRELSKLVSELASVTGWLTRYVGETKNLRARVFNLEGVGSELALSLQDMLDRFSPHDDGLSDAEIACSKRAREALRSAKVVLIDYYNADSL